jgi:hypothetical protein
MMMIPAIEVSNVVAFCIAGANVLTDGTITFPRLAEMAASSMVRKPESAEALMWTIGAVSCDTCGRRLEFPIPPDHAVPLPWKVNGWFIAWQRGWVGKQMIVLCNECLK